MNEIEKLKYRIKQLEDENKFYKDLELGNKYADEVFYTLIINKVTDNHKPIIPMIWTSEHYQKTIGESIASIEVKYSQYQDEEYGGNVFIVTEEWKYNPKTKKYYWKTTGIKSANSKYYVVGTKGYFYLFHTEALTKIWDNFCNNRHYYDNKKTFKYFEDREKKGFVIYRNVLDNYLNCKPFTTGMDLTDHKVIQFRLKVPYVIDDIIFPVPSTAARIDDDRLRELLYYQKKLGKILNSEE